MTTTTGPHGMRATTEEERLARVALSRLSEPGVMRMTSLVAEMGAVRVREALSTEDDLAGVRTDVSERLRGIDPARDLEQAARLGLRFVIPDDDEWPSRLDELMGSETLMDKGGPPLGLWVRGPMRLDELERSVAVVGSRSATTYGVTVASEIGAAVAAAGFTVVSGAAFGIDYGAHRGALAADGRTVAVLACGLDRAYPVAHKNLLDHLAETSAVISELAPGCSPTRSRFLARNRVIAALTCGTVVVEAAIRSGALNTANWAGRLHRPVMGVPGPVTSGPSEGVHQLVRSGAATLVTRGQEVLELIGGSGEHLPETPRARSRPRDRLTLRHQQVLDAVPVTRGAAVDSISRACGIGLMEVRSALTTLHRLGLVEPSERGWRLTATAR